MKAFKKRDANYPKGIETQISSARDVKKQHGGKRPISKKKFDKMVRREERKGQK